MHETQLTMARVVSVVAATFIALASGTNYSYSAWGPQFAEKLKLSSTQQNLIGIFGNLGMYASGIPTGLLIDQRGPRWGVWLGAVLLAAGYYPIKLAFDAGAGSYPVPVLCIFSLFSGCGSCSAFNAALKTVALNHPHSRGTATAFPLSAFGLSAFFFAMISRLAFRDDTSKYLLLLATGTVVLVFISSFFLRVIPSSGYAALPSHEREGPAPRSLHRAKSSDSRHRLLDSTGTHQASIQDPNNAARHSSSSSDNEPDKIALVDEGESDLRGRGPEESSSLLSSSDLESRDKHQRSDEHHGHGLLDIRGFSLLPRLDFWQQFILMGLLTGIGLMTINNIGNDTRALWRHYDDSASDSFIQGRQILHVSNLSLCSFLGRLISGIGSDHLVKRLQASRLWCIFISSFVFCIAQLCAMNIENPDHLLAVSGITGFAYGFLFGCFPSIVAHTFGVHGMSQNWGTMTIAPVIASNIFNPIYGAIFDRHSVILPSGHRECLDGLNCYKSAYMITFIAGIVSIFISLWSIWAERKQMRAKGHGEVAFVHEREA